ncbi:MAG: Gfo/Idh/MocA family oxidoreductase [Armatimonadota bacterium]|jgi:predicted dehydrogenase
MTRRQFLHRTSCAAAGPLILSARARGANDRIALGVLGTGKRGTGVMRTFLGLDGVEVVAVCDVLKDRRESAAALVERNRGEATQGGCKAYSDFREVLARDDVDAVLIAPQDHWHGVMAVRAAESGKDMYCEKPLGVAVRECQAIRDAVRRHAVVFQTGTQQRSDRKFRLACELARNGYLGSIHTVKVAAPGPRYQRGYEGPTGPQPVPPGLDYEMYIGPAEMKPYSPGRLAWPDWYLIWDYCAGFIVNWGVHHLDIALWGCPQLGEQPFELACTADYRSDGLCDNVNAWQAEFVYPDGLRLSYSDTGHPHEQGCRFEGDEGWVHVNRKGIEADPESLLDVTIRPDELHLHESTNHTGDFVNSVRARHDPVAPVEAGHMASTLGLLADIAGRVQRKLRWDPAAERFTDDDEANRLLARPMRAPWVL